jgi:hypothetical protein
MEASLEGGGLKFLHRTLTSRGVSWDLGMPLAILSQLERETRPRDMKLRRIFRKKAKCTRSALRYMLIRSVLMHFKEPSAI